MLTHQGVQMLYQQRLGIIQFVHSDVDLQILLRQRHVLIHLAPFNQASAAKHKRWAKKSTYFEGIIKISNITQIVEESIHASLVILDERIQSDHVSFLGVRWLVRKVLKHLGDLGKGVNLWAEVFCNVRTRKPYQSQCSSGMFCTRR